MKSVIWGVLIFGTFFEDIGVRNFELGLSNVYKWILGRKSNFRKRFIKRIRDFFKTQKETLFP